MSGSAGSDDVPRALDRDVVGTRRLAVLARRFGVEDFVFISTDKAAKPSSLMGATKRICELYLTALNRASTIFDRVSSEERCSLSFFGSPAIRSRAIRVLTRGLRPRLATGLPCRKEAVLLRLSRACGDFAISTGTPSTRSMPGEPGVGRDRTHADPTGDAEQGLPTSMSRGRQATVAPGDMPCQNGGNTNVESRGTSARGIRKTVPLYDLATPAVGRAGWSVKPNPWKRPLGRPRAALELRSLAPRRSSGPDRRRCAAWR